jgi:SAM-dependent methyltransferase
MKEITGEERDAVLLEILKRLEVAKPHADDAAWERAWTERLAAFRNAPSEESLIPSFIRDEPVRSSGKLWRGHNAELYYCRDVQRWAADIFRQHECSTVYEFGCGSGFNLVALAKLLPECDFCGFDASSAAVKLVRLAGETLGHPIGADTFDMRNTKPVQIPPHTGVLTFGAMEQIGNVIPFLQYLIAYKPTVVVHIEPIPELLDPSNLLDWLSLQFHAKRNYTRGFLPYLQARDDVEILHVERSHFGSLMLESYAKIVWRPKC